MKKIIGICSLLKETSTHLESSDRRPIQIMGGSDALLHIVLQALVQKEEFPKDLLLILPHQKDIFAWQELLRREFQNSRTDLEVCVIPYYIVWGPEKYANHFLLRQEKLSSIHKILKHKNTKKVILTTLPALAQFTLTEEEFLSSSVEIQHPSMLDLEEFIGKMEELGYQHSSRVEEKGYYSVRGGIVDVFPIQESEPVRIELIGDLVNSLRHYSTETQRSSENIESVWVIPRTEILTAKIEKSQRAQSLYNFLMEENVDSLEMKSLMASFENNERIPALESLTYSLLEKSQAVIDFMNEKCLAIFPQPIEKCVLAFGEFNEDIKKLYFKDKELNHAATNPSRVFLSQDALLIKLKNIASLEFANPLTKDDAIQVLWQSSDAFKLPKQSTERQAHKVWFEFFDAMLEKGESAIVLCETADAFQRAKNFFTQRYRTETQALPQALENVFEGRLLSKKINIAYGYVPFGIKDEELNVWLISYRDIFGGKTRSSVAASRKLKNILSSFRDLSVGDLVVHIDHGIGCYRGMTLLDLQGYKGDFLVLEYRQGDKIYLPVDRLNLLQKYKKDEGGTLPSLDKLGSDSFIQRKARALKSIEDIAEELIKVHAERKMLRGHAFSSPDEIYERFCGDFPYQETPDQLRCLDDVEADFKGEHPMDRLVVGDVGFGKTEIALRAALRAILEGFQVMFLVPTTVLCYQHFYNFTFRLEKYGVKLGQIHRLVKRSAQKETLQAFENGSLDFLIGTHRILSQDVRPKNLGLLIVDEEQRFGVMQKEKFKKLKANIDILTLSATPIPRTLHMALLGLRDISLVVTPPANRMPVRTIVSQFDERLVKGAIESEILRGGQVFYIHNRVGNLAEIGAVISKLVPTAKVRTAHGQMHEESLDSIIIDFIEQKFNVLVCTTIIESGVDMPNVNTLIVENAQNFGLSQLHQLRGRVGRSSIQAYAYLLTRNVESVSDEAMKRLELLMTHQELGAGFQLANYDLELRGAGNLIGRQQSGQIAGVGLELYVDMLEDKIKELSSVKTEKKHDPEIRIKVTAIIPTWYVAEDKERLDIYKRLFSASAVEEIFDLQQASEDRYGKAPSEFNTLVKIALLRLKLRILGAEAIVELDRAKYEIRLISSAKKKIEIRLDSLEPEDLDEIRMEYLLSKIEEIQTV